MDIMMMDQIKHVEVYNNFYKLNINLVCSYSCQTCNKNGCLLCLNSSFRILNSLNPLKCICKDGYFDDGSN